MNVPYLISIMVLLLLIVLVMSFLRRRRFVMPICWLFVVNLIMFVMSDFRMIVPTPLFWDTVFSFLSSSMSSASLPWTPAPHYDNKRTIKFLCGGSFAVAPIIADVRNSLHRVSVYLDVTHYRLGGVDYIKFLMSDSAPSDIVSMYRGFIPGGSRVASVFDLQARAAARRRAIANNYSL